MLEKRRYTRASIDTPVTFALKKEAEAQPRSGIGRDISIGGMFIETPEAAAFGAEVIVHVRLATAQGDRDFDLPGVVRWVRDGGMGVQFGLLGALETNAITEASKR